MSSFKVEKFSHASNGQPFAYPARDTTRCVSHLIAQNSPPSTPLHVYYEKVGLQGAVSSAVVPSILRTADFTIPGYAGVNLQDIAAHSLQSSGKMALLFGEVNPDKVRIVSHWQSVAMFRYLHAHVFPLVRENSQIMFSGGH